MNANPIVKPPPAPIAAKKPQPLGATSVVLGAKKKTFRLGQAENFGQKFLLWGGSSTGKTRALADLLLRGYRIFLVATDPGYITLQNRLKDLRREDLYDNLNIYHAFTHPDVADFIDNPNCTDIFEFKPDILVWDGYHMWQGGALMKYAAELDYARPGSKAANEKSEAEEAGLMMSDPAWGTVNRETFNLTHRFLALQGEKPWHKIILCGEADVKAKGQLGRMEATGQKTHAVVSSLRATFREYFDVVLNTLAPPTPAGTYKYKIEKQREHGLPQVMEADFGKIWDLVAAKQGIEIPTPVATEPIDKDTPVAVN